MSITIDTADALVQLHLDSSFETQFDSLKPGQISEALRYTRQVEDEIEDDAGFNSAIIQFIGYLIASTSGGANGGIKSEKFDDFARTFNDAYSSKEVAKKSIYHSFRKVTYF